MGSWGERKESGCGPAEEERDRVSEQGSGPAEVSSYIAVAEKAGVSLDGERAGEEDREQQEDDPANLASERRLRRPIVPVPARAW